VARNEIEIHVPPYRVWAVLADSSLYADWVLGAKAVVDADASWPAPGSKLRHRSGVGPLTIEDETLVEEASAPSLLVLHAGVGPVGAFRVRLELRATPAGSHVLMEEDPVEGAAAAVPGVDSAVQARNTVTLERLKELAEGTNPGSG
jgi:uncharacterized protein YndB with AHSA1/START domain